MNIFKKSSLRNALSYFTQKEWQIFTYFFVILIFSVFAILFKLNNKFLISVPISGGTLKEGIIGTPRFVNPVLATSDADKDLTKLIFSGLMKKDEFGNMIPDLADTSTISPDGLNYTFVLKDNLFFHDGSKVTSKDVLYTIHQIQNSDSPEKINWEGITVNTPDDKTIVFTLKKPYASFLENTSIGILPSHLWAGIALGEFSYSSLNTSSIGSGPFKIKKVINDASGLPKTYELVPFKNYYLEKANISKLILNFYSNDKDLINAYEGGDVDQINSISPTMAKGLEKSGSTVTQIPLSRVFGLYFNPNQSKIFTDKSVIKAFEKAINKQEIIDTVLLGYGNQINSPIPVVLTESIPTNAHNIDEAISILTKAGWKKGSDGIFTKSIDKKTSMKLEFSISTGNAPELSVASKMIKDDLEKIGARVDVKIFEPGTLNQDIIKNRNFDALFFGQIINHESDLYAFWHSSQRKDPGLNIASYTNPDVDKLLEQSLVTLEKSARINKYQAIDKILQNDSNAIFVYSPSFIYITKDTLQSPKLSFITNAEDRFTSANKWFTQTEKVWKIFTK